MLKHVCGSRRGTLLRGVVLAMAAGTVAGCSSGASRFNGVDDIFTGATPNQRSIIRAPQNQAYPGDSIASAPQPAQAARPIASQPVARQSLPPVSAPARTASAPQAPALDRMPTGTTPRTDRLPQASAPVAASQTDNAGWSRAGGTEIAVRDGETVYNLSKRYGVPAKAILQANGLASADSLQAGQRIVIPTYVYSAGTGVSAPDASREVADAKSSRGTRYDVEPQNVPLPSRAPQAQVAVLPQAPKVRDDSHKAAQENGGSYTVQSGDSLYAVARKTGASVDAIRTANNLGAAGTIRVGQTLVIPSGGAGRSTQVAAAAPKASLDPAPTGSLQKPQPKSVAEEPQVTAYTPPSRPSGQAIKAAVEESSASAPESSGIGAMRWPVRGRVVKNFGGGSDGIDIAVPEGTAVKAAENGVVIYAGDGLKDFGNTVLVRHDNGLVTVYGHASKINVQRGEKVRRGQEIASSGMSGNASAPKLHFEVRKDSAPVDPSGFLQ